MKGCVTRTQPFFVMSFHFLTRETFDANGATAFGIGAVDCQPSFDRQS